MNKKSLFTAIVLLGTLSLTSCDISFDVESSSDTCGALTSIEPELVDTLGIVNFNKTTFPMYLKDEIPYVDFESFFQNILPLGLYGHESFDAPKFMYSQDKASVTLSMGSKICTIVDAKKDTITLKNIAYFTHLTNKRSELEPAYVKGNGIYYKNVDSYADEEKSIIYDMSQYGIDLEFNSTLGEVYVPFHIMNAIYFAPENINLYYTPTKVALTMYSGDMTNEEFAKLASYTSGNKRSKNLIDFNLKYIKWLFDAFYGLKDDKKIDSFSNYIDDKFPELGSDDDKAYDYAFRRFLASLDDCHTSYAANSRYINPEGLKKINFEDLLPQMKKVYGDYHTIYQKYIESGKAEYHKSTPVRFYGDTAIIDFPQFDGIFDLNQILDEDGNITDVGWKGDAFWRFKKSLDLISEHGGINDIVVDNSYNGGGYIYQVVNLLGFMTNDDIYETTMNSRSGQSTVNLYKVDANADGRFDDEDAYSNYRWTMLNSAASFSSANALPCLARAKGYIRTIGDVTGGGKCSVLGSILPDGTMFNMSNAFNTMYATKGTGDNLEFIDVESGCPVDYKLDFDQFYDDAALVLAADEAWKVAA